MQADQDPEPAPATEDRREPRASIPDVGDRPVPRILVLTPEPTTEQTFQAAFQAHDRASVVRSAASADEALERLEPRRPSPGNRRPTLIVLDLRLADPDVEQFLESLRSDPRLAHLPVLALTATAEDEAIREAHQLGVNSCVRRPEREDGLAQQAERIARFWIDVAQLPPVIP